MMGVMGVLMKRSGIPGEGTFVSTGGVKGESWRKWHLSCKLNEV